MKRERITNSIHLITLNSVKHTIVCHLKIDHINFYSEENTRSILIKEAFEIGIENRSDMIYLLKLANCF